MAVKGVTAIVSPNPIAIWPLHSAALPFAVLVREDQLGFGQVSHELELSFRGVLPYPTRIDERRVSEIQHPVLSPKREIGSNCN